MGLLLFWNAATALHHLLLDYALAVAAPLAHVIASADEEGHAAADCSQHEQGDAPGERHYARVGLWYCVYFLPAVGALHLLQISHLERPIGHNIIAGYNRRVV